MKHLPANIQEAEQQTCELSTTTKRNSTTTMMILDKDDGKCGGGKAKEDLVKDMNTIKESFCYITYMNM